MWILEKYKYLKRFLLVKENYKYFIGYFYDNHKVKALHIMLPKTSAYVESYNGRTKWLCFFAEDDDLSEKYNTIWDKVSTDIKKQFDSEFVYNKNSLKTKIKSYSDEITDFYDEKIPKLDSSHTCLAAIILGYALQTDKSYYLQVFLNILRKKAYS